MKYPDLQENQLLALYALLEDKIGRVELSRLIDIVQHI